MARFLGFESLGPEHNPPAGHLREDSIRRSSQRSSHEERETDRLLAKLREPGIDVPIALTDHYGNETGQSMTIRDQLLGELDARAIEIRPGQYATGRIIHDGGETFAEKTDDHDIAVPFANRLGDKALTGGRK